MISDEELVLAAQSGDITAAETLLHRYKNAVTAVARRFFLAGAAEEDVLQEGMIGLYRAVSAYKPAGAPFAAYARSCIKNAIIDAVKNAANTGNKALNDYLPIDEQILSVADPEERALAMEEKSRLSKFFELNLTEEERGVIGLYLQGESYKSVASKLGVSTKRVDNVIQRVKNKIRRGYKKPE